MNTLLLGIGGLGPWEMALILLIVLIVFGVGKLPEIGAGLGKGIKNFKKGMQGEEENSSSDQISKPKIS